MRPGQPLDSYMIIMKITFGTSFGERYLLFVIIFLDVEPEYHEATNSKEANKISVPTILAAVFTVWNKSRRSAFSQRG